MRFDDPTIGLPPEEDEGQGREPTTADMVRARLLNLFGLVSPASNVAMVFWAPREIRWIGVGAGVLFSAGIWWGSHTGNPTLVRAAAGCHYTLVVLGLIHPRLPEYPAKWWLAFGKLLGKVMSVPIFALLYYLAVTPTALVVRLFGHDPLHFHDDDAESFWREHEPQPRERYERQF